MTLRMSGIRENGAAAELLRHRNLNVSDGGRVQRRVIMRGHRQADMYGS